MSKSRNLGAFCRKGHGRSGTSNTGSECRFCRRDRERTKYHSNLEVSRKKNRVYATENKDRISELSAARYAANPQPFKDRVRDRLYRMQPGQFDAMLTLQNGRCVCGVVFDENIKPQVDHDHACCTGKGSCGGCIRGALCTICNLLLGAARDNPYYLPPFLQAYLSAYAAQ